MHALLEIIKERYILQSILNNADMLIFAYNLDGKIVKFNSYGQRLTGYSESEIIGYGWKKIFSENINEEQIHKYINKLISGECSLVHENVVKCKDGSEIEMEFSDSFIYDCTGNKIGIITIANSLKDKKNVQKQLNASNEELQATHQQLLAAEDELAQKYDELKENQRILRISEERYRLAAEGVNDGLWDWDIITGEAFISNRCKEMLEYIDDGTKDYWDDWIKLVHPDDVMDNDNKIREHLSGKTPFYSNELRMKKKNGEFIWVLSRGKAVWDSNGRPVRMAGSNTDITERKISEQKINYMAYNDSLTGLPNRTFFVIKLNEYMIQANNNKYIGIMYLDLDNFKILNDTMGHAFGDALLKRVADMLSNVQSNEDKFVSRLGGDEFIFILPFVNDRSELEKFAELILKQFNCPILIDGYEVNITSSIGVTVYPNDGNDVDTLLKNADAAMYHAKELGKNNFKFYTEDMNRLLVEKSILDSELRHAVRHKRFVVYYQPQISMKTGEIVGMEALVRWKHSEKGIIMPDKFIPLAEETGLIIPIGELVLKNACMVYKKWLDKGYLPKKIAVNLSARQFQQENLVEIIENVLKETGMDPKHLELEITESIAMQNMEYTVQVLNTLIAMGINISLDDFGTGYSSLNYLKKLPINILKIDKSFVKDITQSSDEAAIAKAIISMGHSLKLEIVAEGVETDEQFQFLKYYACDRAQGYLFSKPVPEEELERMLEEQKSFRV